MIKYNSGLFGFQLLLRLHGSAVFKSITLAIISSIIFLLLLNFSEVSSWAVDDDRDEIVLTHPYPIGALVSALTFLLAFRANFSYNRYWEAMTAVHQMHSKWLDVGMEMAAFHLQSEAFVKPPAFGANPHLVSLERERERVNAMTLDELQDQLMEMEQEQQQNEVSRKGRLKTLISTSISKMRNKKKNSASKEDTTDQPTKATTKPPVRTAPPKPTYRSINLPFDPAAPTSKRKPKKLVLTRNPFAPFSRHPAAPSLPPTVVTVKTIKNPSLDTTVGSLAAKHKNRSLFLQEAAHLISLLSAVAMSTLRNDLEQADSPLASFGPNQPWPHVDPDEYQTDIRKDWDASAHRTYAVLRYVLGLSRTPHSRTLYNAARPFRVVGGVSDAEIEILQAARGPLAKVALCTLWLQEFITREYLAGSTGAVAPPIISRLYQFTSDGMVVRMFCVFRQEQRLVLLQ